MSFKEWLHCTSKIRLPIVYLPDASQTGNLNLSGVSGNLSLRWYNPRTGVFEGTPRTVTGGGNVALGSPPASPTEDWVILLKAANPISPFILNTGAATNISRVGDNFKVLNVKAMPNAGSSHFI